MSLAETETIAPPVAPTVPIEAEAFTATAAPHAAPARGRRWLLDGRGFVTASVLSDVIALSLAVLFVAGPRSLLHGEAIELALLPPLAVIVLAARGTYTRRIGSSALDAVARLAGAVAVAALAANVLGGHASPDVGKLALAVAAAIGGGALVLGRAGLIAAQRRARAKRTIERPTLIVGGGTVATLVARRLVEDPRYGLRPIGFVDDVDPGEAPYGLPHLGALHELSDVAARMGARHVIVAFSGSARDETLAPLVRDCERRGLSISVVPRLFESMNGRLAYERLGGLPLLGLRPVDPRGGQFAVKHAFDRCAALAGLVVLAPVLLAIAVVVRLESPGPVLFRQRRVGRDGQAFDLLKFRSMRIEPVAEFVPAAGDAPGGVEGVDRRTRIGRFLRRSSLDELPQLFNVLHGEMSLVGPRPERPEFVALFARDIRRYDERHRVRSGLTGWAQVNGYRGQTSLTDRVEWDNYYIAHWSLGMDLKILLLTLLVVLRPTED